ncbi:hypothetical protein ACLKA6_002025 [Drosophila palustris]
MATSNTITISINDDGNGNGNGNGNDSSDDDEDDYNCDGVLMQQASTHCNPFNSHNVTKRDWWQRQRRGKPYHMQRYLHNHAGAAACRSHGTGLQHVDPWRPLQIYKNLLEFANHMFSLFIHRQTKCLRIAKNGTQIRYLHMGHSWLPAHPLILKSSPLLQQQQQQWQQQQKWQQQRRRRRWQRQQKQQFRRWPSPCSACGNSATLEHQQQRQQDLQLQQQHQHQRQQQRLRRRRRRQQQRQQQAKNPNCHPYGIGDAASWRHIDAQLHPHPVGQQVSMQLNGSSCPSWAACCQIQNPLLDEQRHQPHQQQQRHQQQLKQQQQQQNRPPWPIPYPMPTSLWPQRQSRVHMGALAVLLLLAITHLMPTMGVSTTINSASNPHLPYPWQRHHQRQRQQQQQHQQAAVAEEEEEAEQRRWTTAAAAAAAVWRPSHGNWRQLAHRKTKKTKYT